MPAKSALSKLLWDTLDSRQVTQNAVLRQVDRRHRTWLPCACGQIVRQGRRQCLVLKVRSGLICTMPTAPHQTFLDCCDSWTRFRLPVEMRSHGFRSGVLWRIREMFYTASFAAIPHVVRVLATAPAMASYSYFQFPAWVEICRRRHNLSVPDDLAPDYFEHLTNFRSL